MRILFYRDCEIVRYPMGTIMSSADGDGERLNPNRLLRHDYHRLRRQWARIERMPVQRSGVDRERWSSALDAAISRFEAREQAKYVIAYDPELPISRYRDEIIDLIQNRQVVVVCGETGSGKSTQLPKLCLEAGLGRYGWIGHTQPRRLAARSIATRLTEELESPLGQVVGYKVRFNDQTQSTTLVKLMTDGVLLTEIHRDPDLEAYDCILIDEAHERSINIDLLLAYLARLLPRRPELRIVITSATIDAERFSEHFQDAIGPAPIVMVEGRSYPVDIRYRGASRERLARREACEMQTTEGPYSEGSYIDDSSMSRFTDCFDELFSEGRGDILAFFPTERDIRDAAKQLRGHLTRRGLAKDIDVLPLYARLTEAEQQRVFQPHSRPRVVLATNVAESSLTVPGIRYVIDTGTARISRYAAKSRVQRLPIEPICQASANQRSGRCGRLGPGIAIRMYDESDFMARPMFAQPEIRRCDLAATILHVKSLGIDELESLPWLDPPRPETVREGLQTLHEIEAIAEDDSLTSIGRKIARLPVSPRIGRMLLAAHTNGCLQEVLIIAAAIETQDPRVRPPEMQQAADAAHARFRDPESDFLSYVRVWDFYQGLREKLGRSRLEKACRDSFLSFPRLREWGDVHRQLVEYCQEEKWSIGHRKIQLEPIEVPDPTGRRVERNANPQERFSDGYAAIHQSILAGLLSGVAMRDDQGKYRGASNMELQIWPGSGLRNSNAKWIVCGEILETTQRYARIIARIDPLWIERIASHCIRYSYENPHFSRKHGSAMVMRKGSLFGLPVVAKHAVPLAPLDPSLARNLLIEHGLAERELVSRARFWQHNEKFLEDIQRIGDKTRRRDCVVDPYQLTAFYREHIPEHVVDRATLERWDKELPKPERVREGASISPLPPPYLSWEQLQLSIDHQRIEEEFPESLDIGSVSKLPLQYRFEPGDEVDGVTVQVPEALVNQLHKEKLEWLVPGLLEEKLVALLKSLPKRLRRQIVPVPDTVRVILPDMLAAAARGEPFWKTLCEICTRRLGEPVKVSDFDASSLAQHLAMRVETVDGTGKSLASSRDLTELQKQSQRAASAATQAPTMPASYAWTRDAIAAWDIDELPVSVVETVSGIRVERYPSLRVQTANIGTCIVDHPHLAEQMLREGLIHWFARSERREIKSQIQFLPGWKQASLWLSDRWNSDKLSDWIGLLMARLAFVESDWSRSLPDFTPSVRTQLEIEALRVDRVRRIALAAAEIGRWLPKLGESYQQVRKRREVSWSGATMNLACVANQLDALLAPDHACHTPWVYLREWPRYLSAVVARLEKLKSIGPAKDLEMDRPIEEAWKDYLRRISQLESSLPPTDLSPGSPRSRWHPSGKLLEYRWMIEEYRVSVHAQKLGTRISVSPKRMEKAREQLDEVQS